MMALEESTLHHRFQKHVIAPWSQRRGPRRPATGLSLARQLTGKRAIRINVGWQTDPKEAGYQRG
jgi:hypothetical protein